MLLIDKDDCIKEINNIHDLISENRRKGANFPSFSWDSGVSSALSVVEAQPTIDAVPVRHGKWIACDGNKYVYALRCSECQGGYHLSNEYATTWDYCPTCGARMDE